MSEHDSYLLCYRIDPVHFGFVCDKCPSTKLFKGLRSLNAYFDMLAPGNGAENIPDVWDGHYRIVLAKFKSCLSREHLKDKLTSLTILSDDLLVKKAVFRSLKLGLVSNEDYLGDKHLEQPIAIYVTLPDDFSLKFLDKIREQIAAREWNPTPRKYLNMKICRYEDYTQSTNGRVGKWKRIRTLGIHKKMTEYPIEFVGAALELTVGRFKYKRAPLEENEIWWEGATNKNGKCSYCEHLVPRSGWNGACSQCGQYERLKPIWSIESTQSVSNL